MEKNGCEREKRAQKWSGGSKRESKNRTENGGERIENHRKQASRAASHVSTNMQMLNR